MNILLLQTTDFPNGFAGSAHASLFVKGLRENGETTCLLIPHASILGKEAANKRTHGHINGVPYFYLNQRTIRSRGATNSTLDSIQGMLIGSHLIMRRALKGKVDAVILATPDAFEYLPVILTCFLFRIPIVVSMVEKASLQEDSPGWRQRIRYLGNRLAENALPRFARGYIVISTSLLTHYRQYLPDDRLILSPILVVPHELPTKGTLPIKGGEVIILYSGTFDKKDGVEYLIRAFRNVHIDIPQARFVLTGKSADPRAMVSLYSLVAELGIGGVVIFTGFIPRADLEAYQNRAHILLVCRTTSPYAQHGFPWKLGEYSLTGKPIVATRVGDLEKYFQDREHLFIAEPEDVDSITEKIIFVIQHYEAALESAHKCKTVACDKFGYLSETKKVVHFLHRIVT